jgi:hypothetical protein
LKIDAIPSCNRADVTLIVVDRVHGPPPNGYLQLTVMLDIIEVRGQALVD